MTTIPVLAVTETTEKKKFTPIEKLGATIMAASYLYWMTVLCRKIAQRRRNRRTFPGLYK